MAKTLVKMDQYNAFRRCGVEEEHLLRNAEARVHKFMVPLLQALSKQRPAWQFVSDRFGDLSPDGTHYTYSRFTIMQDGEELGWVTRASSWRSGDDKYEFDGPRLRKKRNRGNSTQTKDLKKAVKAILADVYALTLSERVAAARKDCHATIDKLVWPIQRDFRGTRDTLGMSMAEFVLQHWDAFMQVPLPTKAHELARDNLRARYERNQAAEVVEHAKRNQLGAVVIEHGTSVHVEYDKSEGTFHQYALETLPDSLKLGVAMLKLVEPETMVDNIGVRVDAKTYYVFSGLPHE